MSGVRISALAFSPLPANLHICSAMQYEGLYNAVLEFWQSNVPVVNSRICVAVSGGADSVALFVLLKNLAQKLLIAELGIAHVNHSLRGIESDADESFVKNLASNSGVKYHCITLEGIPKSGIEEWARNKRYDFLSCVMQKYKYDFVATAHTANDQAETILMRIIRGSGVLGLSAIEPKRRDRIIRPLLDIEKIVLLNWLASQNQEFREDSTNENTAFLRNWVRRDLITKLVKKEKYAVKNLCAIAKDANSLNMVINEEINKWISCYVVEKTLSRIIIAKKGFFNNSIWSHAMVYLFRENSILYDRNHIESIQENCGKNGKLFLLPGTWCYCVAHKTLEFTKQFHNCGSEQLNYELAFDKKNELPFRLGVLVLEYLTINSENTMDFSDRQIAIFDALKSGKNLIARFINQGEKFWPYGSKKPMDANEFLKKQKCTRFDRNNAFIVAQKEGNIVWIPGKRIDERYKVDSKTTNIIKISWKVES